MEDWNGMELGSRENLVTPGSHLRYAFQVLQIRVLYMLPRIYQRFHILPAVPYHIDLVIQSVYCMRATVYLFYILLNQVDTRLHHKSTHIICVYLYLHIMYVHKRCSTTLGYTARNTRVIPPGVAVCWENWHAPLAIVQGYYQIPPLEHAPNVWVWDTNDTQPPVQIMASAGRYMRPDTYRANSAPTLDSTRNELHNNAPAKGNLPRITEYTQHVPHARYS